MFSLDPFKYTDAKQFSELSPHQKDQVIEAASKLTPEDIAKLITPIKDGVNIKLSAQSINSASTRVRRASQKANSQQQVLQGEIKFNKDSLETFSRREVDLRKLNFDEQAPGFLQLELDRARQISDSAQKKALFENMAKKTHSNVAGYLALFFRGFSMDPKEMTLKTDENGCEWTAEKPFSCHINFGGYDADVTFDKNVKMKFSKNSVEFEGVTINYKGWVAYFKSISTGKITEKNRGQSVEKDALVITGKYGITRSISDSVESLALPFFAKVNPTQIVWK